MPIRLNNQVHNNGGYSNYNNQALSRIRYNNRTVWQREITLTNLLANEYGKSRWLDIGYGEGTYENGNFAVTAGHRYFVRARAYIWGADWDSDWGTTCGTNVQDRIVTVSGSGADATANMIITASSSTLTWSMYDKGRGMTAGGQYVHQSFVYMVMDITELETARGTQMSASDVWSFIGSSVFYGNKSFIP